jgi:hypothetical protein
MARVSFMPIFGKCWSVKHTLLLCNAGFHFEVDIKLILLLNLMYFGRKLVDNLTVFNLSIMLCEQVCPYVDKTLKSLAYFPDVLGRYNF